MLKVLSALVILRVSSALPLVAYASDREGSWWTHLDHDKKLAYVAGFFDATEYFSTILTGATLKAMVDPKTAKFNAARSEAAQATSLGATHAIEDNLNNLTPGQIVDGLDITYSDYRNQGIAVSSCLYVVIFSIKGGSDAEVVRLLEWRQKNAGK